MEDKNVSVSGMGFSSMLAVAFIVLKLCHVIDWSWVWVLSPLWIGGCIWLLVVLIVVIVAIIRNR